MTQINLYEQLGNIQFQIDKLETAKDNIVRQIEIQMTIESIKQQEIAKAKLQEDENDSKSTP